MKQIESIIFGIVAFVFGMIYVFIIPPFQAPDEAHHFYRAYHISTGHLMGEQTDNQRLGGEIPLSLHQFAMQFRPLRYHPERKISRDSINKAGQIVLEVENAAFVDFPNVGYYATFGYLPQSVGIGVAKLFNTRPLYLLYTARIINLFSWIILMIWAIRIFPIHKKIILYLGLLPASLFFHSGLNPDAITHGLFFVLLAYLLKLIYSEAAISWKVSWLFIISGIVTINKVVYTPVILLALLIPKRKFRSSKDYWFMMGGIAAFHLMLIILWYFVANHLFIPYDAYNPDFRADKQLNPGVVPLEQLKFIITQPFKFIKIAYVSYEETLPWTLKHYVGKFGWEGNYLPKWVTDLLLYTSLLIAILDVNTLKTNKHRFAYLGIGLLMVIAFSIIIYMQWSPPANDRIRSLSGRYFIPIFPLIYFSLFNLKRNIPTSILITLIMMLIVLSNSYGINAALWRYYY